MKRSLYTLVFVLVAAIANAQSLTINGNSKLVMRGNVSLVVRNAALINNGTLIDSAGTVQFSGDKDTTFSYLGGSKATSVYNLSINKGGFGTAIKTSLAVQNVLGVYTGILYPDSNLVLRSDKNLTARVDVVPAGANIVGKAIVERYFPKRRAWRLVTSPLTKTTTIFDTWQNKGVYTAGTNTFVTGPNPTGAGGNGLDVSPQNNSSMKSWNVATQALEPVLNTYTSLSKGNSGQSDNTGYFLFVRGDRDISNFDLANCTNTTLRSNGQLQVGTQNFTACTAAGGYTLVGNPFASPIDFNLVTRNHLVKRFYVWDPSLNIVGGYVMLDDLDNDGNYTKSINASPQTKHIQSGQAFFVETQSSGVASIGFPESSKSAGNNNAMFRPSSPANAGMQSIRVVLNLKESDNSTIVADGVLFEGAEIFDKKIDRDDALKFGNINETMALLRNGYPLAAERSPRLSENDTLFLKLLKLTQRNYQFEIEPADINDASLTAWLEDSYLQTAVPVDLYNKTYFEFTVDDNAASALSTRFRIVFKRAAVLPVTILSVKAMLQNSEVAVTWVVTNEINISKYEVERSSDGVTFSYIAVKDAAANGVQMQYSITDKHPLKGYNYYRIKYIDENGSIHYSIIVKVDNNAILHPGITVYPNPIENNLINVQFTNCEKGTYRARLMNEAGQLLYETSIVNNNTKVVITPTVHLPAGSYLLELSNASSTVTKKIMVK